MRQPWSPDNFRMDMNLDGRFTAVDVILWLKAVFFLPGDCILYFFITAFPPPGEILSFRSAQLSR